jgi:formylglycine-generating enzyme required for sulfatase activity
MKTSALILIAILAAGVAAQGDSCPPYVSITGHITTSGGEPLGGVTVYAEDSGGVSATTDDSGDFELVVPGSWTGWVTPAQEGYTFSPASRYHFLACYSEGGMDFGRVGDPCIISGYITDASGAGIYGVEVWAPGAAVDTTLISGYYSLWVPYEWSGTVTVSKAGYTFKPESRSYTNVTSPQTEQNYTASSGKDEDTGTKFPHDLVEVVKADYSPLAGLDPDSRAAQDDQRQTVRATGLPLEVQSRQTGIVFRLVPAGTFTMGSPAGEAGRFPGETQHQVRLSQAFYCGKFELTQGQWEQVMGRNPAHFLDTGREAPVEQVSWEDVQTFLKRLCEIEGVAEDTYCLLSEAQWEYACRAGSTSAYCFDDSASTLDEYAWYFANGLLQTHPVGQRKANAFGLHDMHGNVWEWCQDWYGPYASDPVTDPLGPSAGADRVGRGGAWSYGAWGCRSALRLRDAPGTRAPDLGVRLARIAPAHE